MTTINRLNSVDVIQDGDKVPLYDSGNGDARKASMSQLKDYVLSSLDPDAKNFIEIEEFGGGVTKTATENSLALIAAVQQAKGRAIIFGNQPVGSNKTYSLNSTVLTSEQVRLVLNDCIILGEDDSSSGTLIRVNGKQFTVTGTGTFDCNNYYANALMVYNQVGDELYINYFQGFRVVNCFQRSALTSTQANAITVWGGFAGSIFKDLYINKVESDGADTVANGAIARGIVIRYLSSTYLVSKHNLVEGCHIEDLKPASEADGVFAQESPYTYINDNSLTVDNCTFINCEKRAVKGQMSTVIATNNQVYRNRAFDLSDLTTQTFGVDFDAQYGGAYIAGNKSVWESGAYAPSSFAVVSCKMTLPLGGSISSANKRNYDSVIANNTVFCGDDTIRSGDKRSLVLLQNRVASDDSFWSNFNNVTIHDNIVQAPTTQLLWGFLIGTTGEKQFNQISLDNNAVDDCTQVVFFSNDTSNTPAGATTFTGDVSISNTSVRDKEAVKTADDTGISTSTFIYKVDTSASSTKVAGHEGEDIVIGNALNTEVVEFDVLREHNGLFRVDAMYTRRTNSPNTPLVARYSAYVNDIELAGQRYITIIDQETDSQAGQWEIVGDIDRQDADTGLYRTTIRKTAGTTTDAYGAFEGEYSVKVVGAGAVAIVAKDASTGTTPSVVSSGPGTSPIFTKGGFVPGASSVTSQFGTNATVSYIVAGEYRVTFDTAQPDTNYSVLVSCDPQVLTDRRVEYAAKTTTYFNIHVLNSTGQTVNTSLPTEISFIAAR